MLVSGRVIFLILLRKSPRCFHEKDGTRNPVNQIMVEIQNTYLSTGTKEVVHNHSTVFSLPMGSMGLVYSTQHLP